VNAREVRYRVYVIKLKRSVWKQSRKFRAANPDYVEGKPLVYVGSTRKTPEQRFERHMEGGKGSRPLVRRFGKSLFEWAYRDLPTFPDRRSAERLEEETAKKLREQGWGVWYNARPLEERLGAGRPGA
jgi:Uri superfamily endonuclease